MLKTGNAYCEVCEGYSDYVERTEELKDGTTAIVSECEGCGTVHRIF